MIYLSFVLCLHNLVHFSLLNETTCIDYEIVCVGHMLEALCPLCPFENLFYCNLIFCDLVFK